MPRQDVPYGGAICRLRERIAEIFDKLGEKLHTINGVPGDGDGNVKIVSGSSAVVISNDPTQNEIAVSLDTSQLPAASVSSVNGQTGAVALTADDVPSDNGDVQTDIDNLEAADTTLQGNINAEALARQNADSTLQTNINAVLASIPNMSVTPDPYKGVERDAQGRAFAADPASGATDKTLITANWVSQTGDNGPNNLIHKTGSETKSGQLILLSNTLKRQQYAYIDYDYSDSSVIQHKGIRFYVNGVFSGEFLYRTNPADNSINVILNIGNTLITPSVFGSMQFKINADGTKEIITNFPKPSNW